MQRVEGIELHVVKCAIENIGRCLDMANKASWYTVVEAMLYEIKTYDLAIYHMQQRSDMVAAEAKIRQKREMSEIVNKLTQDEQDFIKAVYVRDNTSPCQLQIQMCLSEATYFRKKRQVVKKVAQYFGFL